jgi:ornithine carbamoyltransferase
MDSLIDTESLTRADLEEIWSLVSVDKPLDACGAVACSFQGSGTRTRTTFLQAVEQLGLQCIDLPPFLDTRERIQDLSGYLDPFYALYVIRHQDHEQLAAFAAASKRPVINAMSAQEHPCEAISDAYWFHTTVKPLEQARVVLWGEATNVLRSWRNVAEAAGAVVSLVDHERGPLPERVDLVVTDGWPRKDGEGGNVVLQRAHLDQMGSPLLLPTPPFTIGEELAFDPLTYPRFVGYEQKACLLHVQKAIIRHAIRRVANSATQAT